MTNEASIPPPEGSVPLPRRKGTDVRSTSGRGGWSTSHSTLRERAKTLRTDQAEPEAMLWDALRAKRLEGLEFRRQVPIGRYIVDFLCPEHRLVVEVDDLQHQDARRYDDAGTAFLQDRDYRLVRFDNDDVLNDLDGVCSHIAALCAPPQPPLPDRFAVCPSPPWERDGDDAG